MSTISNERLEEIAEEDFGSDVLFESSVLARELLALRKEREKAEPVAWRHDDGPFASGALTRSKSVAESWIANGWKVTPLYAAPPAPVDDDSLPFDPQIAEYEQMMEAEQVQADTTEQQFESLAGKAVGGWIPCSEQLPEEGGRYLCYVEEINSLGKSHYQWNCSWNGDVWGGEALYGRVTHWQPLPEPPCK